MSKTKENAELEATMTEDMEAPKTVEAVETIKGPAPGSKEWYEEKVEIKLFKDSGDYKDDVFVQVNGKAFIIKRGVKVKVPRYVALVLENSQEQDEQTADLIAQKGEEYDQKAKELEIE